MGACVALGGCASTTPKVPSTDEFTRQDHLRGSITPEREWWDLLHYDLTVRVFPETKYLEGANIIRFRTLAAGDRMQVDLQPPLKITRVSHDSGNLAFEREGNVYWIQFPESLPAGQEGEIQVFYEGHPVESTNPPWSGGLTWTKDEHGQPFIATTCQGDGASLWWPNKDHGADEPQGGVDLHVTVPESLVAVCNGRLKGTRHDPVAKTKTYDWQVLNPINNYCVNINIGNYVSIPGTYAGEGGKLDIEYWVLKHQVEIATEHFKEAPRTLEALEHWFGPYPFSEDSYKLVVVPYLGMEHQSSVTYGNGFKNGFMGGDLSATGVGLKFDYIVIHESAHEWFGNNISMKDAADMWIHESFACYAENLFVDYHFSKEEAEDYVIGCRRGIGNEKPIIGVYGVNREGAGDMYSKGANMLHTMRQVVNDDEKWRGVLRGLNEKFWHKTVTTEEFEAHINLLSGHDFDLFFDQYLRTPGIPVLKYAASGNQVSVRWDKVVPGFHLPVLLRINGEDVRVDVGEKPRTIELNSELVSFELDRNFYMNVERE